MANEDLCCYRFILKQLGKQTIGSHQYQTTVRFSNIHRGVDVFLIFSMVDCVPEDLGNTVDTFTDSSCQSSQSPPSVGSVQIGNGTACYDGLQTGSEAAYSCDCGFRLQGNEMRRCQQNGLWSGTTPACQTDCKFCGNCYLCFISLPFSDPHF